MKRLLLAVFFLVSLILPASASEKANTVLIHPGETVYARFETKGKKLKLVSYSKEKDEAAQVIFTMGPDAKIDCPATGRFSTFARSLIADSKTDIKLIQTNNALPTKS